jgi:hypothetical protein
MKITIRAYLTDRKDFPGPGDDYDLERRLYFEDRIRRLANKSVLGPDYTGFIFTQSHSNLRGQEKVDFGFAVAKGSDRAAAEKRLRPVVDHFMKIVKAHRRGPPGQRGDRSKALK